MRFLPQKNIGNHRIACECSHFLLCSRDHADTHFVSRRSCHEPPLTQSSTGETGVPDCRQDLGWTTNAALRGEAAAGHGHLSPDISRAVLDSYLSNTHVSTSPLSRRERQVLQLVSEGRSTKDVAVHLGTSVKTPESHRARLLRNSIIH